ncbi:hypothetical protein [Corynebacterium belfantii]|uniref:Uncharacterized protein n=1 Tax=Corynebacterium belfantii TaxID=2014537 RepID=A0ABS0LEM2_9CORY|nr:hypothetical protein [Corynebacterium belfantii]OWM37245.1 hypothetical protein AZF07_07105 [Corynebacterium diphtheriae subsp. lausannense]MBG9243098.1 hypothetical protein [Corynebacterium belfantii]MBG9286664.1 hypothetical protein [Corynebacterium belfantii]MBG9332910.1 hypothetical protein [Corynebacterium belfantii]MBG9347819.1 hypothetical protein [Corynebacterium belfantii]
MTAIHTSVAAQSTIPPASFLMVYVLFLVSGLLVGGAWAAYKADNKLMVIVLGVLAAMAAVSGVVRTVGIYQ